MDLWRQGHDAEWILHVAAGKKQRWDEKRDNKASEPRTDARMAEGCGGGGRHKLYFSLLRTESQQMRFILSSLIWSMYEYDFMCFNRLMTWIVHSLLSIQGSFNVISSRSSSNIRGRVWRPASQSFSCHLMIVESFTLIYIIIKVVLKRKKTF